MECCSKWNVTQNGISLKIVTQNGKWLKWNVTQNEMSFKMEFNSKLNVTQNGM